MRSSNLALSIGPKPVETRTEAGAQLASPKSNASNFASAVAFAPATHFRSNTPVPRLSYKPLLRPESPRRFVRVPTYAVGVHPEHREYPRATLQLPLKLQAVNGETESFPVSLVTRDISSTGVYFLCPKELREGSSIELQIVLVSRPMGQGNVVMACMAHVCRADAAATPGWYGVAASYDDVQFDRDDFVPSRFLGI